MDNVYDTESTCDSLLGPIQTADAIAELSQQKQAIIGLRYAGYIQQEVADLLGISRTTVRREEQQAISELKAILTDSGIEDNSGGN